MSKYSKEYKSYYKGINQNTNKINRINRKENNKQFFTIFIYQFFGSIVLLGLLFILKNIPISEGNDIYVFSKNALSQESDLKNYKEQILDNIDQVKKLITGEETLREKIKKNYILPAKGEYKSGNNSIIIESKNKDIIASFDGIVSKISEDNKGQNIIISHDNGVDTYYGYLENVFVEEGEKVNKGKVIGKSSNEGVYFKLIYLGIEKNPLEFINNDENNLL